MFLLGYSPIVFVGGGKNTIYKSPKQLTQPNPNESVSVDGISCGRISCSLGLWHYALRDAGKQMTDRFQGTPTHMF